MQTVNFKKINNLENFFMFCTKLSDTFMKWKSFSFARGFVYLI